MNAMASLSVFGLTAGQHNTSGRCHNKNVRIHPLTHHRQQHQPKTKKQKQKKTKRRKDDGVA
jgi:hypothetical protein